MKNIILLIAAAAITLGCARETLRSGDLIFVGIPMDYSLEDDSMSSAIADATGDGELNIIHVAIADVDSEGTWIIDATIRHGVDRHPLDTFLCDFTLKDGSLPVFEVMRLKDSRRAASFVENAKKYLGLPYDTRFLPDNGALYCSELVRESYLRGDGKPLFDEFPMNFRDREGNMPLYWEQLFAILGMDVPQDVPGTNPQEMSSSPLLRPVNLSRDFWK